MLEWTNDAWPLLQRLLHVALAMVLGGAMGAERELANKSAGLRTMMLVAGSSAVLVQQGRVLVDSFAETASVNADPIRVIHAIVIGISFLGAGTIVRDPAKGVEGLTTAATVLIASAIGISVALEQIAYAVALTVMVLAVLALLGAVERAVARRRDESVRSHGDG